MNNVLNTQRQTKQMAEWEAEINTCFDRLKGASDCAIRAVTAYQAFAAISTADELTATGASSAEFLLTKSPQGIGSLATLIKVFASGSGKTVDELLALVATAAKQ